MEVDRLFYVEGAQRWHRLTGVPAKPFLVQDAEVDSGDRFPDGTMAPSAADPAVHEIVPDRARYERLMAGLGLVLDEAVPPSASDDLLHGAFRLGWRGLRAFGLAVSGNRFDLDRPRSGPMPPSTRFWTHRDKPRRRP